MPDLEQVTALIEADDALARRVAALEEAIAFPLRTAYFPPMSDEETARFREDFEKAARQPYRVLSWSAPLSPDEVRYLLRECVTVVKPGETLILRVPWTTTPTQVRELQVILDETTAWLELPFKALVLPGDELTVAETAS